MTAAWQWAEGGRKGRLLEVYRRWTRYGVVTVPAGFVTDFASIPRLFWTLIPKLGPYNMAAVIHDYLYRTQPDGWTRRMADEVFYDLMREDGVRASRAWTMHRAVRLGGWVNWRRARRAGG
jgi:hypothetical protein